MSSKLLPADSDVPVGEIPWKQVKAKQSARDEAHPRQEVEQVMVPEAKLRELQAACEERLIQAHAAGRREGEALAREQCAAELKAVIEKAAKSLEEITSLRPKLRREAEGDLVRLALAIARRVLFREVAVDPDVMRGVVMATLEKLEGQEVSRVRVHPDLAKMLSESLARLGSSCKPEVISDSSRERGTLIFETSRGNLDASVETQLQEIERGLVDQLRRRV